MNRFLQLSHVYNKFKVFSQMTETKFLLTSQFTQDCLKNPTCILKSKKRCT